MKKVLAAIISIVVVLTGLTIILSLFPLTSGDDINADRIVDNGYFIESADYNIVVSDDRTAQVTERLTVRYRLPSNGIIRWLPTNSGEQYYDVGLEGDVYTVDTQDGFIRLYIGPDTYPKQFGAGDSAEYKISYKIVPPTKTAGNTNYYMNVVPFGWDTSQENVSVTMTFPYEIKDAVVYAGSYGTTQNYENFVTNGNTLEMHINKLESFSGVTVNADMGRKFNVNFSLPGLIAMLIAIASVTAALCIKFIFCKDKPVVPVINAYPPHDGEREIDPAQMGYLIDMKCEPKDMTAMIFYFASKGLLKLKQTDEDNFKLIKCGEIDESAPLHQKILFNGLFKSGSHVTTAQLQNHYYGEINAAASEIKGAYAGKLHDSKINAVSVASAVVLCVASVIAAFAMLARVNASMTLNFVVPIVFLIVSFIGASLGKTVDNVKHKYPRKIFTWCVAGAIIAVPASLFGAMYLLSGVFPFYGRVFMLVGLFASSFVCGLVSRKSDYYVSIMNDVVGFKTFIETAEKDRLEAMVNENPQYYYDVLPYANVLGVSKVFEEKFESLENVPPPVYYDGPTIFDLMLFNTIMRSSFVSYTSAFVSRPGGSSYSGGGFGGFGGGGFGGGGFGGGGGGRH